MRSEQGIEVRRMEGIVTQLAEDPLTLIPAEVQQGGPHHRHPVPASSAVTQAWKASLPAAPVTVLRGTLVTAGDHTPP